MTPWCWSVKGDLCHGTTSLVWATALFCIPRLTLMAYKPPGWYMIMSQNLNLTSHAIDQVNTQNITISKYMVSHIIDHKV